jgi:hypothetical protein
MYPHERSLVQAMQQKPFVILGVNSDSSKDALKKIMTDEKISWRSWWDGGNTEGPIASKWNVQGWPTMYVVDHAGKIRHKWMGSPGDSVLDQALEKLVKEAQGEASQNR